jgi:hypothetical protein
MNNTNSTPRPLSPRERAGAVTVEVTDRIGTAAGPHPNPLPEGEGAIPPCEPIADRVTPELKSGETGYDVIKHLVGKAHGGSGDLSTNPEHLARYGR